MISLNDVLLAASNIPVDDPIAEIWGRQMQGGYKIIEYTGTLPITISANGDALLDYRIYGASGGVGEPTDSGEPVGYKLPMMVQSENLFDSDACDTSKGYVNNAYLDARGDIVQYSQFMISEYLPVQATSTYLFMGNNYNSAGTYIVVYNADKDVIATVRIDRRDIVPVYTPVNAAFVRLSFSLVPRDTKKFVCVKEKNVYIGENQLDSVEGVADYVDKSSGKIVRMIGEYTFTGDENFNKYGNSDVFYTSKTIDPMGITTVNTITMRCNHPAITAIENKDTRYWLNPEADDICCFLPGGMSQVFLRSTSNFTTAAECKAYLKAQYDNGTPVKISYWLKTSIEEASPVPFPEIPTIKGETIIDYDGVPKPSQMYVKYKGKG